MYFRFWGTCADHAGLLHRYTHGNVVCCLHPPFTYIWHFSLCYPSPTSPPQAVPPLAPCNRPQYVMLPSLRPCVLIVHHLPMSENMWCLISCSCVSLLRMMVSRFIHVPTKTQTHRFLWLHSIPWYICAAFSLFSLSSMGQFQVCYCKQCCNEHTCARVLIIEQLIILWIYTQ